MTTKYIFVTGGVVSSLGKGVEDIYRDLFGLDPAVVERSALEVVERYLKTGNRAPKRNKR